MQGRLAEKLLTAWPFLFHYLLSACGVVPAVCFSTIYRPHTTLQEPDQSCEEKREEERNIYEYVLK